jgi:hypothetical protein
VPVPDEDHKDGRFWEAHPSGWHLALVDFSVADQPGHKPGDRGQNFSFSTGNGNIMVMGDDSLFHALGRWLVEQIDQRGDQEDDDTLTFGKSDE